MEKDVEMSSEQMMTPSTSNTEPNTESPNITSTTFYTKDSVTKPSEILMSLILPTVADRLKYHQEIIKLKESNT